MTDIIKILSLSSITLALLTLSCKKKQNPPQLSESDSTTNTHHQEVDAGDTLTIAFGSCSHSYDDLSYFRTISESTHPDLWIWLGDIIYGDSEDMEILSAKYNKLKNDKSYSDFIQETAVIGAWDDHDYGANDAGKEYPKRYESSQVFSQFLDLDKSQLPDSGIYQTYGYWDDKVKVILLDTRFFRDKPKKIKSGYEPDTTIDMLGNKQWEWLESVFSEVSPDQTVILSSGIQIIPDEHRYEKWANFPASRSRLFNLLDSCQSDRIYLISGDRHRSEIMTYDLPTKKIYEITSSGLTHSYADPTYEEPNQYRFGPQVIDKSFATFQFDSKSAVPIVCLHLVENGQKLYCMTPE